MRDVHLVTGFLGSGKTTLVAALLRRPELARTAVIVNELGEVGIDHHLLRRIDERTVLLASGCVCCTLRGDLADELRDLLDRADAGEIPGFERVVVETTGLAEPTPIVNTLLADPFVPHHYSLASVVATVDAQHGLRVEESVRQAAAADVLVLTKTDQASGEATAALEEQLARLNPTATVVRAVSGDVEPATVLRPPSDVMRRPPLKRSSHASTRRRRWFAPSRATSSRPRCCVRPQTSFDRGRGATSRMSTITPSRRSSSSSATWSTGPRSGSG